MSIVRVDPIEKTAYSILTMQRKNLIKITLSIIATIFLTKIAFKKVVAYLSSFSILPGYNEQMQQQITLKAYFSILIFCFAYLFFLVSLPFIMMAFAKKMQITRKNLYKVAIGFEIIAMVFAYFSTPPDMTSTMLVFLLLQLPIIVNILTLLWVTGNRGKEV